MGNPKAFLSIDRQEGGYRPKEERVKDYNEVEKRLNSVNGARRHRDAWSAAYHSATGAALWATASPNGRTVSTKMTSREPTAFSP